MWGPWLQHGAGRALLICFQAVGCQAFNAGYFAALAWLTGMSLNTNTCMLAFCHPEHWTRLSHVIMIRNSLKCLLNTAVLLAGARHPDLNHAAAQPQTKDYAQMPVLGFMPCTELSYRCLWSGLQTYYLNEQACVLSYAHDCRLVCPPLLAGYGNSREELVSRCDMSA